MIQVVIVVIEPGPDREILEESADRNQGFLNDKSGTGRTRCGPAQHILRDGGIAAGNRIENVVEADTGIRRASPARRDPVQRLIKTWLVDEHDIYFFDRDAHA